MKIGKRVGSFEGRPHNGHCITRNSIPEISGIPDLSDMKAIIHGKKPKSITLDGKAILFETVGENCEFVVDKDAHSIADLLYEIVF